MTSKLPALSSLLASLLLTALFSPPVRADKAAPDATLTGHTSAVLDVAFSADGKRLASAADDGKLKVWDVASKKEVSSYDGVHSNLNRVRFTPDGKTVVALGSENNVVVLDADAGKPRLSIPLPNLPGGPSGLDLSPDGKTLAVVGRGALRLFDLATGKNTANYEVHAGYAATAVAFAPDGKTLATTGSDHVVNVIDPGAGKVVRQFKVELNGVAVTFSGDGKALLAADTDQKLYAFDLATGAARTLVDQHVPILTLAPSSDGKSLFLGGPGHAPWVLTLPEGKLQKDAYACEDRVKSAAVSPDGKTVAGGGHEGSVFLWKVGGEDDKATR